MNNIIKYYFHTIFTCGGFLYSNNAKSIMLERGYKADLNVIYNSLDYEKQIEVVREIENGKVVIDVDVNKPYVVFSGRLIPERNLELLFDAVKILKNQHIKLNVLIIGDGQHATVLKSYAESIGVMQNVVFYGACYDEQIIGNFFMNAVACVFPGPIGLTIIHSMTYGTPVITNDNYEIQKPEIEALNESYNGFLFEEGSAISLAAVIKMILLFTPEEKQKLKRNAKKTVAEKFTPRYQAEIIKEAILKYVTV